MSIWVIMHKHKILAAFKTEEAAKDFANIQRKDCVYCDIVEVTLV